MELTTDLARAYKEMWTEWKNFYGRTDVAEYWGTMMMNILLLGAATTFDALATVFLVASLLPMLSMTVRRLNDSGTHWAWLIPCLIPVVGWILFIVLTFRKSKTWLTEEEEEQLQEETQE